MSKSIMHEKAEGTCYLCMLLDQDHDRRTGLEEHHVIMGNPGRRLSEHYGLKVYLCMQHHREGKEAVHNNIQNNRLLQKKAQEAFERHYPRLCFREVFGINFMDVEDRQRGCREPDGQQAPAGREGFRFIQDGIEGIDWNL